MRSATIALIALTVAIPAHAADITGRPSVIDGDTIEIHGQRIRLHGIDAPEGAQLCYRDGESWPCGRGAAFALADFIGARTVRCEPRDRDRARVRCRERNRAGAPRAGPGRRSLRTYPAAVAGS